jgi:glycosyltransferase involved in cell wall biosynthesis
MQLAIVIPCYNEEEVLPETARRVDELMSDMIRRGKIAGESSVYFVDDGSRDRTWSLIEGLAASSRRFHGIKLSRNRGHQTALLAGLQNAKGDAIVSVDADLQDDLNAIEKMVDAYREGADVVYGVRQSRGEDTAFKRLTAEGYYKLLAALGVDVVFNHADYRLMSRRAVDALCAFDESNLFIRGIIPQIGFPSAIVKYDRRERFAGESKYPLKKMIALAWNGVTSFSAAPLRLITGLGAAISVVTLGVACWALAIKLFTTSALPGWASTVVPIYFLGGVQLLAIGIMGEYLAKIYLETKRRPKYFVDKLL